MFNFCIQIIKAVFDRVSHFEHANFRVGFPHEAKQAKKFETVCF